MTYQSKTPQGVDKVSRYKWTIQDQPGTLAHVHKADILFDDEYQRDRNESKIKTIAREWSWLALGAIILAERDGQLYAVDGMHRVSAALLRSDVAELPCIVFASRGSRHEADAFIRANTNRKAVTTAQSHKAKVVAGDEVALLVDRLLKDQGIEIAKGGARSGQIKCMGVMHRLASTKRQALLIAWPIICELSKGNPINEKVLDGVVHLFHVLPAQMDEKKWRDRLFRVGYFGAKSAAESAASYYSKGGARVWADGILQAINKGAHHKLEIANGRS